MWNQPTLRAIGINGNCGVTSFMRSKSICVMRTTVYSIKGSTNVIPNWSKKTQKSKRLCAFWIILDIKNMFSLYTLQKAGLSQGQLEFFCWEMYSEWGRSTSLWHMTTLKNENSQDPGLFLGWFYCNTTSLHLELDALISLAYDNPGRWQLSRSRAVFGLIVGKQ